MLVEIGHFALIMGLLVAGFQGIVPLIGAARRDVAAMAFAKPAALVHFTLILVAFGTFMFAHIVSDFSVLNVVNNSHTTKPMLYKITGVWGSHEGSMLLWVFILAFYGALMALLSGSLPTTLKARALAIQGLISFGMLAFVIFTSDPFLRVIPAPINGNDLNPLLQDPGLAFHPPFLYLGYVGFSVSYSFAIAGLIEGRIDSAWARWLRPWTLTAWVALTIGIALGSWWAYYVLGWGGWWYWDPVENASFMPWLLGTALLHSVAVVEKRETVIRWTLLLAIITFGMSLIGTFLVRSGVITSVHAFASDPKRGSFILALIALVIGGGLTLFTWRAPSLAAGNEFELKSRESTLIFNNFMISIGMLIVFFGTFWPLFTEIFGLKMSVGAPFFNLTFPFAMVPAILVMAIAPMLAWRRAKLGPVMRKMIPAGIASLVMVVIAAIVGGTNSPASLFGVAVASWVIGGVVTDIMERGQVLRVPFGTSLRRLTHIPQSMWGGLMAHFGVGILVAGIAVSTAWKAEKVDVMRIGETATIAGRTVTLVDVTEGVQDNYQWQRARLQVETPSGTLTLFPERRNYPVARSQTIVTSISSNGFADLYSALGDPDGKGGYTIRLYFNPLVPWIWFGAGFAALGGIISLTGRRLSLKTARKRAMKAAASQGANP